MPQSAEQVCGQLPPLSNPLVTTTIDGFVPMTVCRATISGGRSRAVDAVTVRPSVADGLRRELRPGPEAPACALSSPVTVFAVVESSGDAGTVQYVEEPACLGRHLDGHTYASPPRLITVLEGLFPAN